MGQIQNSVVGALGAVGVAARMIGNEKDQTLRQGQAAQEQNKQLEIENKQAESEVAGHELDLNAAQEAYKVANQDLQAAHELRADAKTREDTDYLRQQEGNAFLRKVTAGADIAKAEEALQVLQDKINARNFMMENNQKAIVRAQRWGGRK